MSIYANARFLALRKQARSQIQDASKQGQQNNWNHNSQASCIGGMHRIAVGFSAITVPVFAFDLLEGNARRDVLGINISRSIPVDESSHHSPRSLFFWLASPINYFLVPKQANERDAIGNNIGEQRRVLEYVMLKFDERYGTSLSEFLNKADMPFELLSRRDTSEETVNITYKSDKAKLKRPESSRDQEGEIARCERQNPTPAKANRNVRNHSSVTEEQLHEMARLYLEQSVSFRNLERKVLGIDSQARGGGFVAKNALNDLGITASDKGMLAKMSPREALESTTGKLRYALIEVYVL